MPGVKTNEIAGTRAVLRHYRMSAYKARQVLDLVRGKDADRAAEILDATPREAARVVGKVLASAVANARNNDQLDPDELYVSACYADEGTTLKRWRPRARGRATRIRKRTCHITVIVSRLPDDRLERRRARLATENAGLRSRRVAASRRGGEDGDRTEARSRQAASEPDVDELETASAEVVEDEGAVGDEDGGDVEAVVADGEEVPFEEPEWLNDEVAEGDDADVGVETATAADTETDTDTDTAAEAEPPAAKPRRARSARKSKTKAAADADDGDAGEEEKD
jgi:large subunit ribosomal protein L22